jgi:hypothetical protein
MECDATLIAEAHAVLKTAMDFANHALSGT